MKKVHTLVTGLLFIILFDAKAQSVKVPLTLDSWDTIEAKVTQVAYLGKESLLLESGAILVKNADLKDGVIEADISFPQQRGFPGFAFRMQDLKNFENFYVRPHQSGNPDATQYTPIFNGQAGWQLYHGDGYSNAHAFRFDQWHHVKIDLHGLQAEVYIDDMQIPVMKVTELLTGWKGGKFGLISGGVPLHIANVQYTLKEGSAPAPIPVPATGTGGLITQWQVSNVVDSNLFKNKYRLTPEIKNQFTWTTQRSEPTGTINLARFGLWQQAANTMVAKVVVESASAEVKTLQFGFSDFVTVYLNDVAIFSGSDNFMSRDYRFLGTIGYFDRLFLPLKKGRNELWFVVSEYFGGWGLKAKFEDMEKIRIVK